MIIDEGLIKTWEIGRVLLACHETDFGDLTLMKKENGLLQLARKIYLEDNERFIMIEEYNPANIRGSRNGGCIESAKPTRLITIINDDEYYGRTDVSDKKQKYIEILRGF